MNAAPQAFRSELRAHNRHAAWMAIVSLLAAAFAWGLAYFLFVLILLGLVTAVRGDWGPDIPDWIPGAAFTLGVILLVWGTADAMRRRFAGASDRAIIGWHLFGDFLLLPVRMTFAIWGNFGAMRRLDDFEIDRAWELVMTIHRAGRARMGALALVEPDRKRLLRLLGTLQMLDYIDVHRGEKDWFYVVRSAREPQLRALIAE